MLYCCRRSLRRRRDGIGTDARPEKEGGRAGATRRDEAGRLAYQAGGPSTAHGMGGRLSDRGGELQEQRRRTSLALLVSQEIYSETIPPEPRVQPIRTSKTGGVPSELFSPPRRGAAPHNGACVFVRHTHPSPEKPASQRGWRTTAPPAPGPGVANRRSQPAKHPTNSIWAAY